MSNGLALTLPQFHHPELEIIFRHDVRIPLDALRRLLELDREQLVADLVKVLESLPAWEPYFQARREAGERVLPPDRCFVVHTISLLGALRATVALPAILELLRLPADALQLWLGDFLPQSLWEILYWLHPRDLAAADRLVRSADHTLAARRVGLDAITQIAWHQPIRRPEVLDWFGSALDDLLAGQMAFPDELLAHFLRHLTDLRAPSLLPEMEQLFRNQPVDTHITGDWERIAAAVTGPVNSLAKRPLYRWEARYKHLVATLYPSTPEVRDDSVLMDTTHRRAGRRRISSPQGGTFQRSHSKVGRNDPCPCGSGKKYKKCHGR